MVENSKIEWTDHTMNFWVGCTKVSPACDHCYAESWAMRTGHPELWKGELRQTTLSNRRKALGWNVAARSVGMSASVFTNSLSDFFDNQVPPEWRADAWITIEYTRWLNWLILTKRPQNIASMLPADWNNGCVLRNVAIGTTVENQKEADRRIPHLLAVLASMRFLSAEPLLEAIEPDLTGIDWVICGGESGGGARKMDPGWARRLRDQCREAKVPFFMKQMAKREPIPEDLMVREFPAGFRRYS